MADPMTEAVYTFIRDFRRQHGYPPSQREICAACYMGRSTAQRHLDRLEIQGRIARDPGRARGITLIDPDNGSD